MDLRFCLLDDLRHVVEIIIDFSKGYCIHLLHFRRYIYLTDVIKRNPGSSGKDARYLCHVHYECAKLAVLDNMIYEELVLPDF